MGASAVLVCALHLLGPSAAGMPPIELVAQRPSDVTPKAEAFVRRGSGIISVLTDTHAYRSAECGAPSSLAKLASILVHEASHVRDGPSERLAYEAQLRALLHLGIDPTSRLYRGVQAAMRAAVAGQDAREKQATPPAPGSRVPSQPSGRMNSGG